jgi:hypothetical protein
MSNKDRLWERYWRITEGRAVGYAMPILWHLALRGDDLAMTELGARLSREGRIAQPFSQAGLAYRAFRRGQRNGAQHLAMNAFNRDDLLRYRYWLARGATAGDQDAKRELSRFETRLPHQNAARIGRLRPYRGYDFD